MSCRTCVHFTPAQGRSRGRAPLFLIQEYPRLPGFPSDVYGIMTQRSDSARPRPYAELDQALNTLGGYVLFVLQYKYMYMYQNRPQYSPQFYHNNPAIFDKIRNIPRNLWHFTSQLFPRYFRNVSASFWRDR